VMNPQARCELIADSSPAVKQITQLGQEPFRVVGLNYDFAPGYGGALGLEQIDSADPLLNRHYRSLIDAFGATLLFGGANVAPVNDRLEHDLPLFNMLNVRYYLGHPGTKAETLPALTKIGTADLNIYESNAAWPRAFFSSQVGVYDSEEDFVALLTAAKERPFVALAKKDLERQPEIASFLDAASTRPANSAVKATDYILTNNRTSFKVNAPSAGVIVLSEPYLADDFQVRVNGKPENYFRVNSAFRGVFVAAPGQYDISFAYWPQHFTLSLWIAVSGLVLFLGLMAFLFRNRDSHLLA
jgi:Bacterial membrane protein YfhO